MIKVNKAKLILSSLVILIPWFLSLGRDSFLGNISSLFILVVHLLCVLFTSFDRKNKDQNKKVLNLIYWACPAISVMVYLADRALASGKEFTVEVITTIGIGLAFMVLGNYFPKCKQNHTIGIKIPWTLQDEENWNRTHRLGGKLWVSGGFLFMLSAFVPGKIGSIASPAIMLVMVFVPMVYSFLYSRKQKLQGTFGISRTDVDEEGLVKSNKKVTKIGIAATVLIFAACGVLMFTGNIRYVCEDDALEVEASYWDDFEIEYEDIRALELRENSVPGSRVGGFGSGRLLMGNFRNEEFGYYTRYTYTGKGACIVMTVDERIVVLGCKNSEETRALFEELVQKVK